MSGITLSRLPTGRAGQAIAVLLVLLLAAAAWLAVASPLLDWHAERADAISRRATLARRMAQIAADLPRLEREAAASAGAGPAPIAVLGGGSDAVAGAALQQRLQDMATQAGTTLSSTEALPPQPLGGYRAIGVRVTINAPWPSLVRLLQAIDTAAPQMLVDDLQVHGAYGFIRDGNAPLNASLSVIGFRAETPPP
jgi:general secretion pathway protein M